MSDKWINVEDELPKTERMYWVTMAWSACGENGLAWGIGYYSLAREIWVDAREEPIQWPVTHYSQLDIPSAPDGEEWGGRR